MVLRRGAKFTISHGAGLHEVTAGFSARYLGLQVLTPHGFVDLFASLALIFLMKQVVARATVARAAGLAATRVAEAGASSNSRGRCSGLPNPVRPGPRLGVLLVSLRGNA